MAVIQVTPELLQGKATEVRQLKSQHDELMAKMRTLIHGLNDQWKGAAQDAFVNKFDSMQSTFTNFSEMLDGYAVLMENTANNMQEMDMNLANRTNSSF